MHLVQCKDQRGTSLEEFYDFARKYQPELAVAMLDLVATLRGVKEARQAYVLTSHLRLVLLAQDDYRSPWWVIAEPVGDGRFAVEQLVPEEPDRPLRTEARTAKKAVKLILKAMDRSGGWTASTKEAASR